jgi:4-hydroxybenzoate polyprenyltransferase
MKRLATISKRLYSYQKQRFPVAILALSLLPAALSSGAVVSSSATALQTLFVVIASIAYLFHIRVIDEHRDFCHDNEHHPDRPVQSGVISKDELWYVDCIAIALLLYIAITAGFSSLVIAAGMLGYAYIAGKEFFVGEKIRKHFFLYNGVNLVQMLLMQVFVYAVFADPIPRTMLVLSHFLFTATGTLVFEFVRKLKIPGDDGTGKDTYTSYLGFNGAMSSYMFLTLTNIALFFWVATHLSQRFSMLLVLALIALFTIGSSICIHWLKKTRLTDHLMQLSFVSAYGAFNLIIFFLARH